MKLDFKLPRSWGDLSQNQLKTVYKIIALNSSDPVQYRMLLALNFSNARFLTYTDSGAAVSVNGMTAILDKEDLLALADALKFLETSPDFPVRLFEIAHRKAIHPLMRELSFAQWLALENFYLGFLTKKDPAQMNEILQLLYPAKGVFGKLVKPFKNTKSIDWRHICAMLWIEAFKKWLTRRYPEIYKIRNQDSEQEDFSDQITQMDLLKSMNAQIRALTKGDITKKEAVLEMDMHSALEELDALALEARKFNEDLKRK